MLHKLVNTFDRGVEFVCCVIVVALLFCVALGVVSRGVNNPFIWTDELSRLMMVWLAVVGWILASRRRAHIRIRLFSNLLPVSVRRWFESAVQITISILGVLIAWFSVDLIARNFDVEATSLQISISWMYVPMFIVGAVMTMQAVFEFISSLRGAQGPSSPAEGTR